MFVGNWLELCCSFGLFATSVFGKVSNGLERWVEFFGLNFTLQKLLNLPGCLLHCPLPLCSPYNSIDQRYHTARCYGRYSILYNTKFDKTQRI